MTDDIAAPTLSLTLKLAVAFEAVEGGHIQTHLPALPGIITCAQTMGEARATVADALREYLRSLGRDTGESGAPTDDALVLSIT